MSPLIGITSWSEERDVKPVVEINRSFVDGVLRGGGLPMVLPILEPEKAAEVIDGVHGIVLTGGFDMDPASYGAQRSAHVTKVDPDRDAFEVALVHAAVEAGRPVLGLCRGNQVLNVARGGTLVQHLADVSERPHDVRDRVDEVVHEVSVQPGSLLAGITGLETIGVNSLHHQAVAELGTDLVPVAWSDDGIVEAVEDVERRLLGVQWHPELMLEHRHGHLDLFEWVVDQASLATAGRSR